MQSKVELTSLTISKSKVGLSNVENTALSTSTHYIGTTSIQYNRTSASQTLTGVSIDGNSSTVTNGVYTTGSYSNPAWITSLAGSKISGAVASATSASSATQLGTSNWTVLESGGYLYFQYGGANKMRLDSSGNLIVTGNMSAYGSI